MFALDWLGVAVKHHSFFTKSNRTSTSSAWNNNNYYFPAVVGKVIWSEARLYFPPASTIMEQSCIEIEDIP